MHAWRAKPKTKTPAHLARNAEQHMKNKKNGG
jgi:hypothetical protein